MREESKGRQGWIKVLVGLRHFFSFAEQLFLRLYYLQFMFSKPIINLFLTFLGHFFLIFCLPRPQFPSRTSALCLVCLMVDPALVVGWYCDNITKALKDRWRRWFKNTRDVINEPIIFVFKETVIQIYLVPLDDLVIEELKFLKCLTFNIHEMIFLILWRVVKSTSKYDFKPKTTTFL